MAKSRWMIARRAERRTGGTIEYRACRLLDREEPDEEWNREYCGNWSVRRSAVAELVQLLNEREAAT